MGESVYVCKFLRQFQLKWNMKSTVFIQISHGHARMARADRFPLPDRSATTFFPFPKRRPKRMMAKKNNYFFTYSFELVKVGWHSVFGPWNKIKLKCLYWYIMIYIDSNSEFLRIFWQTIFKWRQFKYFDCIVPYYIKL